jgi:hypothetical protein
MGVDREGQDSGVAWLGKGTTSVVPSGWTTAALAAEVRYSALKKVTLSTMALHPTVRMEVASTSPPVGHRMMQ